VAAHGDGEAFTVEQLNSMLRRIRAMAWFTIVLAAAIIWVALTMVSRTLDQPATASRISARAESGRATRASGRPLTFATLAKRDPERTESMI